MSVTDGLPGKQRGGRALDLLVEYGPLAAFLLAFWRGDLMLATQALLAATLAVLLLSLALRRRIPPMPLVTAGVVLLFGGLTLYFRDETFIKMKPTIVYLLFAAALGAGLWLRRLWLKSLLARALTLPDAAWRVLTLRFILFFLASAGVNEILWRSLSDELWVTFKVFGFPLLGILFMLSQLPFIMRHMDKAADGGREG